MLAPIIVLSLILAVLPAFAQAPLPGLIDDFEEDSRWAARRDGGRAPKF